MLENKIVVFKARADLVIYVVGSRDENELITEMVLDAARRPARGTPPLGRPRAAIAEYGRARRRDPVSARPPAAPPRPRIRAATRGAAANPPRQRQDHARSTRMRLDTQVVGALSILLSGDFTSTFLLQHLDVALLTVDEVADDGIILETDPKSIVNRVLMRGIDGSQPMTDMSLAQAMEVAKEQLLKNVV